MYHAFVMHLQQYDGSTDRCCFAIVTNERTLLPRSDQPVRTKTPTRRCKYCVFQPFTNVYRPPDLRNGIWCIVNIGNGYELNNNKGKTD